MNRVSNFQAYLDLANNLFAGQISERDVFDAVAQLPFLDIELLDQLAEYAEEISLSQPRHNWAIAQVFNDAANSHSCNLFTRSKAAWYLGRASNHWGQPKRVDNAISKARQGFEELNELGWIAACDWQLNVLSWTRSDFNYAVDTLKHSLKDLERANFNDFVPHCRLALAYAQILIGKFDEAKENITASEAIFFAQEDLLNQARCWLNNASRLRRISKFDEAIYELEKAQKVFQSVNAPMDLAKAYYQLGLIHLLRTDDLTVATSYLERAAQIFTRGDLDLWQAACATNLGAIFTQYGRFANAEENLQKARASFTKHDILGLLADNLNDSGKLNMLSGFPEIGIRLLQQSKELSERLGSKLQVAVVTMNLGEAFGQTGRYQDALYYLELATESLKPFNDPLRLGTCENYTAFIWWRLGQPSLAHEHLDKATTYYREANQVAYLSLVHNFRANLFFENGEIEKTVDCLMDSLKIAQASNIRPHAALARRLLGEVYLHLGRYEESRTYLEQALNDFSGMDMAMEYAATLVSMGAYFMEMLDVEKGKEAFKAALNTSQNSFPEIAWRAHVGIAGVAETQANIKVALHEYHKGEEALHKVRFNFWQPALASSYLKSPSLVYDQAVDMAAKADSPEDALSFIENNKAITLIRQLSSIISTRDDRRHELNDIRAEINWLQEQLKVSAVKTTSAFFSSRSRQIQAHLIEKTMQYDTQATRLERQGMSNQVITDTPIKFNLSVVKKMLKRALGRSWVALDYYLTEDQLVIVILTPNSCRLHCSPIPYRIKLALEECLKARRNGTSPFQNDLNILGDWLIPPSIAAFLTPDTYLLLAPHRKLHGLPWGAIQPSFVSKPLAYVCIPSVIPSLHSLAVLYKRHFLNITIRREHGLIIGVSKFQGRHPELPRVNDEIEVIKTKLGPDGDLLQDNEATWINLQRLAKTRDISYPPGGLSRFAWFHIASHVFSDAHTGRLSGLALWDSDIWLDQLRDLAPLPRLVIFSACNSIYSVIHQGDEHVGLPTTCLMAGSESVIGSIWLIQDRLSSEFMSLFYEYYLAGKSPARALVDVQRQMIERDADISHWASFVCVGIP